MSILPRRSSTAIAIAFKDDRYPINVDEDFSKIALHAPCQWSVEFQLRRTCRCMASPIKLQFAHCNRFDSLEFRIRSGPVSCIHNAASGRYIYNGPMLTGYLSDMSVEQLRGLDKMAWALAYACKPPIGRPTNLKE